MSDDAVVAIVLYSVAAGCALLSMCATPKEVVEEPTVVGTTYAETSANNNSQVNVYVNNQNYYPQQNQGNYQPATQVTTQPTTQTTAPSTPQMTPQSVPQSTPPPTKVSTDILTPTSTTPATNTASQPATTSEAPKESMQDAFIKRYLKAYYTGDSSYVISKNAEDLDKDQGLKELIIQDVENAKAEAENHGGFSEVEIKNATTSGNDVEFYVNVKFKDGSVAEQHKFNATQKNKVWKAY